MDRFHIESVPKRGTTVSMGKLLPVSRLPIVPEQAVELASALAAAAPRSALDEVQQQNHDLLQTLDERELTRLAKSKHVSNAIAVQARRLLLQALQRRK
jgi:hypothetical protein